MKSTFDWLENEIYLPGYMALISADQSNKTGYFNFRFVEPPVARIDLHYLTPRGAHIGLSQASYWLIEKLAEVGKIDFINVADLRKFCFKGYLKMTRLTMNFRKEIKLDDIVQGKITITHLRPGKMPIIKMDYLLGERAWKGEINTAKESHPVPQTNSDIMRK